MNFDRVLYRLRLVTIIIGVWAGLTGLFASETLAAEKPKKIPDAPYYYVLDEPRVLSPEATRVLQTLLIEHDRLTGEQILLAIFNDLESEELVDFTNRVFTQWKIGKRGKDNGALLALFWKNHKARIEVGYGLEHELTDAKSSEILSETLLPALREGSTDQALIQATVEIFRVLESPLIQNGKAQQIIQSGGVPHHANRYSGNSRVHGGSAILIWLFFIAFTIFSLVMNFLHAAEARFTRSGWRRPSPLEYYHLRGSGSRFSNWGSGGSGGFGSGDWGGGSSGDGGGFMGGGGSSGGGGASGSW